MRRIASGVLLLLSGITVCLAQAHGRDRGFVIEPNKPFVYMKFDHMGQGVPFAEGEPVLRVWFRLVNNCRVPITVRTFGPPDGSPREETGVMYDIVATAESGSIGIGREVTPIASPVDGNLAVEGQGATPNRQELARQEAKRNSELEAEKMPVGYSSDVSSATNIVPGGALLFSVPANHFNTHWHIEIPFEFVLAKGTGPRHEEVGGEPVMTLSYSIYDLPTPYAVQLEHR